MKTRILREVTLYRYRYLIGYIAFGILLLALLLLAIDQAPRGLSSAEMESAVLSVNINILHPTALNVIDAPYHLLQKLTIHYLGLTPLGIKLPSIFIGALMGVSIILMLQRWFRKNVAILTALIIVTSVGFLSLARMGTPEIMTAFWAVMLLLGSTHVLYADKHRFFWKLFCFVSTALLAYSPYGIFPLLAMVIAGIIHPHVRYRLSHGPWWQHVASVIISIAVVLPLIIAIIHTPAVASTLLGLNTSNNFSLQSILPNIVSVVRQLFDFTGNSTGAVVTPMFGIATIVLLLLGMLKLFTATYSARSYMLFVWLLLLIPVLILHPDMVTLVLVPATLVLAIGIETLIRQWYDLFPRNPYARIAALIPLSILLISIVSINMERYFYGHHYSELSAQFHQELPEVRNELRRLSDPANVQLVVMPAQRPFYDILRREYPSLRVTDSAGSDRSAIVLGDVSARPSILPSRIVTSDLSKESQAVVLRVYDN